MINLTKLRLELRYKICYKNFVVLLQASKYNEIKYQMKEEKKLDRLLIN